MSELRYNSVTGDWVIIASERAKRPRDFKKAAAGAVPLPAYQKDCPFCAGNEAGAGEEVYRIGTATAWQVRSIYNKFPALTPQGDPTRHASDLYTSMGGFGFHEVLVEHPRHDMIIATMSLEEIGHILRAYHERYAALSAHPEIEAVIIFKNQGPQAGASLVHAHSQIIATPIVPPHLRARVERAEHYHDVTGACPFCAMVADECVQQKRTIFETEHFVSFVPFAPAVPFLCWIVPRRHMGAFNDMNDSERAECARHLQAVLGALYRGLDNPDFNYTIRSVPVREKGAGYFHWYLSVVPRITNPAGFELGSGIFINALIPEECAAFLRPLCMH